MAVTFRAATAMASSNADPATYAVTVDATDDVLIVPMLISGGTLRTGGAPSYAGQPMTQAGTAQVAAASPETNVELWYLLNPPAGTANISVPNTLTLFIRACGIGGVSSTGAAVLNAADGGNGTAFNPADTITTTADGCLIVGICGSGANTWAPSAQTGTDIETADIGNFGFSIQYTNQVSAGAFSVGWTFGAATEDYAICSGAWETAVAFVPKGPLVGPGNLVNSDLLGDAGLVG